MAVILTVGGTQLHYAQGTWPRAIMNGAPWKFSLIPDNDYDDAGNPYQGKYLVATDDIGGFYFDGSLPAGTLALWDDANVRVWTQQITFSGSQVITITLDHPNREVTVEGATTGNGTYSYSTALDIFRDTQLDVGANPNDIFHFVGVISDFEDFSGGDQTVEPAGIPSGEAFGTPSVALQVAPTGIASAQAFGSPAVTADATVAPTSITSAEAFGTPAVVADAIVAPTGIASAEAFGAATVVADAVIAPSGIASAEAFGAPSVGIVVAPTGIESGEAFGNRGFTGFTHNDYLVEATKTVAAVDNQGWSVNVLWFAEELHPPEGDLNVFFATGAWNTSGVVAFLGRGPLNATIQLSYWDGDSNNLPPSYNVNHLLGTLVLCTFWWDPSDQRLHLAVNGEAVTESPAGPFVAGTIPMRIGDRQDNPFYFWEEPNAILGVSASTHVPTAQDLLDLYAKVSADEKIYGFTPADHVWDFSRYSTTPASIPSKTSVSPVALNRVGVGPSVREISGPAVALGVAPGGIPSAEAFGLAAAALVVSLAGGIPSAEAFGTPAVEAQVAPTGIPSAEAFGTPTVELDVSPSGIASAEAFGAPTVTADAVIAPAGIPSAEAFGTPIVGAQAGVIYPSGIPSAEAFGTPQTALEVAPAGIPSAEAFGTPAAALNVAPQGIASAEAVGIPALELAVAPLGIPSAEAFGAPGVAVQIAPSGIASAEAFGQPSITAGAVISPTGIPSAEAFGIPIVVVPDQIYPPGIPSAEAFGTPLFSHLLEAVGIPSAEAFGDVSVGFVLEPAGIPSAEAFGVPSLEGQAVIAPAGIPSAEAFGTPTVLGDGVVLVPSIPSAEAFGTPTVDNLSLPSVMSSPPVYVAVSSGIDTQFIKLGPIKTTFI